MWVNNWMVAEDIYMANHLPIKEPIWWSSGRTMEVHFNECEGYGI